MRIRTKWRIPLHLAGHHTFQLEVLDELFATVFSSGGALDPEYESMTSARDVVREPRVAIWSVGDEKMNARERRGREAEAIAHWIGETVSSGGHRALADPGRGPWQPLPVAGATPAVLRSPARRAGL